MCCYVGESLPHYDAWRTQEPEGPAEEPAREYTLSLRLDLAAEIPPSELEEAQATIAAAVGRLVREHIKSLPLAWDVEDVTPLAIEEA